MAAGDWFGGRHSRPHDDPEDREHLDEDRAAQPSDDGFADVSGSRPTQALPTVTRSEGLPADDVASVRAVAKRVPSALPALGRDGISDVPPSARATADRRRQAREAAVEPAEPVEPPPAELPRPRPPEVERVRRVPGASLIADPPDPGVELVPLGGRPHVPPPPPTPEPPRATGQERPYGRRTETPPATQPPPPPPALPPPPPPPTTRQPEAAAAELIEERPPRPYAGVPEQTDEWAAVPPPHGMGPQSWPQPGFDGPPDQPPLPHGPGTIPADTWETSVLPPVAETYQGRRRRLRTGSRLSRAGWVVVLGVVLALSAAVAVPFLLTGSGGADQAAGTPTLTGHTSAASAATSAASGLPVIGIPAITETPTPSPTSRAPDPAPTFAALTVQAEDHGRDFNSRSYCNNVKGVLLGNHGSGSTVNFGSVTVPDQATYRITVYAATEASAVPLQITIDGKSQPNWSVTDCNQTKSVSLELGAGAHSVVVTFKGNGSQNVLVDKIVIERP